MIRAICVGAPTPTYPSGGLVGTEVRAPYKPCKNRPWDGEGQHLGIIRTRETTAPPAVTGCLSPPHPPVPGPAVRHSCVSSDSPANPNRLSNCFKNTPSPPWHPPSPGNRALLSLQMGQGAAGGRGWGYPRLACLPVTCLPGARVRAFGQTGMKGPAPPGGPPRRRQELCWNEHGGTEHALRPRPP